MSNVTRSVLVKDKVTLKDSAVAKYRKHYPDVDLETAFTSTERVTLLIATTLQIESRPVAPLRP